MKDGARRGGILSSWLMAANLVALGTFACSSTSGGSPDGGMPASSEARPDGGGPTADATSSDAFIAPSDAGISDASPDACDSSFGTDIPDLTTGYWVYFNAVDSAGDMWDGSNLTFNSVAPACGGATLTATMNWFSSNGQYSTGETYLGTYVSATRQVTWNGQALFNSYGSVVLEDDTATYDPSTDQLVNGSWVGGHPGTFSARHVTDAGAAPGATDAGAE